jgi:PmbA protein
VIGRRGTETLLKRALAFSSAQETEAVLLGLEEQLTRFANNVIHQHVAETNHYVVIRTAFGQRVGVAATNDLTDVGLERAVEAATTAAKLQAENPDFPGLPGPVAVPEIIVFDEPTAGCSPAERARDVRQVCQRAEEMGCVASGAFRTGVQEWAVVNSHGLSAQVLPPTHRGTWRK